MRLLFSFLVFLGFFVHPLHAKSIYYADVEYHDVVEIGKEMLSQHASFHDMDEELAKRVLERFLFHLDPLKMYFLSSDIEPWIKPNKQMIQKMIIGFSTGRFEEFQHIIDAYARAIARNEVFEKMAAFLPKPEHIQEKSLKNVQWLADMSSLLIRLRFVQALEETVLNRFDPEMRQRAEERFKKRKKAYQTLLLDSEPKVKEKMISTLILKAFSQALDSQSAYFTPVEASQFVIAVQQKLFGIGVLFRDDLDGFTVLQLVQGGPAELQGELRVNDKVIAVDNEPVVGVDLYEVVELIRGQEDTHVTLKVLRETSGQQKKEEKNIVIKRGEVIVSESRLSSKLLESTSGPVGYLHLSSFYQDEITSSSKDMHKALIELMSQGPLKGVILDLRGNPGGILQQAVEVCGLFMDNALICSVKEGDSIYPFWNLTTKKVWDGPLLVLVDRTSASASEIVAQSLQDWGRAVIIGDDRTFGKGSFQMLSFAADTTASISSRGEYKISRGRYYTTSGKSPQLVGVRSDIEVDSPFRFLEIGECYSSYPLSTEAIQSYFDTPQGVQQSQEQEGSLKEELKNFFSRAFSSVSVKMQKQNSFLFSLLPLLRERSMQRLSSSSTYQAYLQTIQAASTSSESEEVKEDENKDDFACKEALCVLEDVLQVSRPSVQQAA